MSGLRRFRSAWWVGACGRVVALAVLLSASSQSRAALHDCALDASHWAHGALRDVVAWSGGGEQLVVLASGAMLQVYDVSAPAAPALLGEVSVSEAIHRIAIAADGERVATSSRFGGITLVDIADRTAPAVQGVFLPEQGRLPEGMAFDGDLLYTAITPAGLAVIDVSDPAAPLQLAQVVTPGTDSVRDVAVRGQYVYVADDAQGVTIWDVADPAAPLPAGAYAAATNAVRLQIIDDRAYVARAHEGFDILDLGTPTAPTLLGSVAAVGNYPDPVVANGHLVLPVNNQSLRVFDLDDPAALQPVAEFDAGVNGISGAAALGNAVFVVGFRAGPPGLRVVDVTTPATPAAIARVRLPGAASTLHAAGGRVYVPQGEGGLAILGNTTADRATQIGRFDATPIHMAHALGHTVVGHDVDVDDMHWLRILDVSDAATPSLLASVPIPVAVYRFAHDGNDLFVASPIGMQIFAMDTPATPLLRSTTNPLGEGALALLARGNRAYIGTNGKVHVVDIADRDAPLLLGSYAIGQPVTDFAVLDDTLFVASDGGMLHALDVSTPATITARSVLDISPGASNALELDRDRLYIASGTLFGTLAYDVSDPSDPIYVERFDTSDEMVDVGIDNGTLVVAESGNGVRFFACPGDGAPPPGMFVDGFETAP